MARFCQNCGSPLGEGTRFCPTCGMPVAAPAPQPQQPAYQQPQQPIYQQPQQPVYQQPVYQQPQNAAQKPPKKKKGGAGKALIPILSVLLVVCILVTGFVYPGFFKELGRKTETVTVTEEAPAAKTESGVCVEFSPYMLEQGQSMKVKVKDAGVETAKNGDYQIKAYDITAGDLHDLGTYIRIRIPYDDSFCAPGSDPAKCVCAKYKNPETGRWEDVLYTVDAENKELVIETDHLSMYGCFTVENEGLRGAYITEASDYDYFISDTLAVNAMREWASGGQAGDACYKVADIYVKDMIKDVLLKSAGDAGDIMGNFYTVSQMGDFQFDSKMLATGNEKLGKAIEKFGKIAAAANIAYTLTKSDKTSEDILGLYKDCFNFALSFSEEAAVGISMVGVWCIDKSLNKFATEVQSMRIATVAPVYRYFNDSFDGNSDNFKGENKARTSMDWLDYLKKLTKATKGDEETFKMMLEDEVDRYARRWFALPLSKQEDYAHYIQTIVKSGGTAGSYWYSALSDSEKEDMITSYKGELYDRLIPIMNKVSVDSVNDLKKQKLEALNEIGRQLSATIPVKIHEVVPEGEKPRLGKHPIAFSKLNDNAIAKDWQGTLKSDGTGQTSFTQIGYILAGSPKNLDVYAPGAAIGTDKPILSVPFTFHADGIDIPIIPDDAIRPEDIVGSWSVKITFSNIQSPLVGMLQGFFAEIFGEDNDIVSDGDIDDASSSANAEISIIEGTKMRVKLIVEDVTMTYEGKLKDGKLDLKLVSQTADDEDYGIQIPLDKIALTFVRRDGAVVMDGSYHVDTFLLKADMLTVGQKK